MIDRFLKFFGFIGILLEQIKPRILYVNPYTITITSEDEIINNTGDTYQLVLVLTVDLDSALQTHTFKDRGMLIINHGITKWKYSVEDALVTPQSQNFEILDSQGFLRGLLMGTSAEQAATQKQFNVTLNLNGSVEFIGDAVEDGITCELVSSGNDSYIVRFLAFPDTSIIAKQMLYDAIPTAINPFGYTDNTSVNIVTQITDIYELVNPSVTLTVDQDWLFEEDPGGPFNVDFVDVAERVDRIWFDDNMPEVRTCADVLRKFAEEYVCMTGMVNFDEAFFVKLGTYNAGTLQTLGTILKKTEGYIFNLIYYVTTAIQSGGLGASGSYTRGIDKQSLEIIDAYRLISENGTGLLNNARDPDAPTPVFADLEDVLADAWFRLRGSLVNIRADTFVVEGIDYAFLDNFDDNGFQYQILELEKNWEKGTSKIVALNLGTG